MITRVPGRPRNPAADRAILEATLQLLDERGYSGLALTEVAERAGVSTATLYRRWSSKVPLVLAAMQTALFPISLPDTGNTRQDLIMFLQERIEATQRPLVSKVLPALAAEGAGNPAFVEQFRQLQAPIRQMAFRLFERGIARGDLPASLDQDLTLDLLLGPLVSRQLINIPRLDPALAPTIVDAVLYGVARR
ncbi:TetR/AcrR family transcriptional regulator [Ktedonobacter racemifer]|uniref:Transcriptional regulator, TetR family n=1 Tax=Ktedonobacter racemifer DSM 44963 TaxID=485913 RepID=D6TXP6_KTERA|nr:TetR/AcrR family transcriptional regulator [Ktedonobacter racemifer]EFH83093.1 transcriptional regulator, TetR family [Ktedonobacter racemifer DSM 44963]